MMENWNPQYQQISFGNKFMLRGANIGKISNGIQLQLIWESIGRQQMKYGVAVHVLNADGKIVTQADYMQNNGNLIVDNHVMWLDKIEIPQDNLTGARRIGIALFSPETTEFLHPDRGDRDWNNQRLIIALPATS